MSSPEVPTDSDPRQPTSPRLQAQAPVFGLVVADAQGGRAVQAVVAEGAPTRRLVGDAVCSLGTYVLAELVGAERAEVVRVLAIPGTPLAGLYGLLADAGASPTFAPDALAEAAAWQQQPGLSDPALVDLRALSFCTIDGADSRDLDQAVFVEEAGSELRVCYALADASYYVRPGTALWRQALARGASYYLPGLMVPMLPRSLSEGLISLNPAVERRALVFDMRLDSAGACRETKVYRAKIRSLSKLSFEQVQSFYDSGSLVPPQALEPAQQQALQGSLQALRKAGGLRIKRAADSGAIRYRRVEMDASLSASRQRFVATVGVRHPVEAYNEQLSLLCNAEGARLLREASHKPFVEPVYRVHPAPDAARLEALRVSLGELCHGRGLPEARWAWQSDCTLADYLAQLPDEPEHSGLVRAIHRQAVMTNVRSSYQSEPAPHHGVGADVYARFSAPMREMVGVFLHNELLQALSHSGGEDTLLVQSVMAAANRAKQTQRRLTNAANLLVLDQIFGERLEQPLAARGLPATIVGFSPSKVYLQLRSPPIDVKVRFRELKRFVGAKSLQLSAGATSLSDEGGRCLFRLGDLAEVVVLEPRSARRYWGLGLRSV